jgi:pyridoxal 5'-phosphate synthase pdxS subunit
MRLLNSQIRLVKSADKMELANIAKNLQAPLHLIEYVHEHGKLPVPNFSAGGIATPSDAALLMQLGAESVFVGSGIFKSSNPEKRAKAIVKATTYYNDPKVLLEISKDIGPAMTGINCDSLTEIECFSSRGN